MKTLELKHYLNTGAKVMWIRPEDGAQIISDLTIPDYDFLINRKKAKLICHPLSDLIKPIEHNGDKFIPIQEIYSTGLKLVKVYEDFKFYLLAEGSEQAPVITEIPKDWRTMKGWQLQKLIEWHFDVFYLIAVGLAIDINTLEK